MSGRRRGGVAWALGLAFIGLPLLELYLVIQVGQAIGAWWTILLLVVDSVLGALIVRREGGRAWRALREALAEARMPHKELADGALVLIGGTLLLTPGFVTDALGALLVLPVTRPFFRGLLARVVAARLVVVPGRGGPGNDERPGPVVRGDVVDPPE
ncbi:MAG: FxsA family protein [Actinobacteria bacterium]|nr:FxsA family protein [Actinomycetota bacterium]